MRVKYLAKEHNTMTQPGLEPGPLDPESSALTTRPPRLPLTINYLLINHVCFAVKRSREKVFLLFAPASQWSWIGIICFISK